MCSTACSHQPFHTQQLVLVSFSDCCYGVVTGLRQDSGRKTKENYNSVDLSEVELVHVSPSDVRSTARRYLNILENSHTHERV